MAQLTRVMFGTEFQPKSGLFGLRCGQIRSSNKVAHNAGWYNKAGERLGWGDLSSEDFQRICSGLEDGELFIALSEENSFWRFVAKSGIIGSMAETDPNLEAPGVQYVADHAWYIFAREQPYFVDRRGLWAATVEYIAGIKFSILTPAAAKRLIVS